MTTFSCKEKAAVIVVVCFCSVIVAAAAAARGGRAVFATISHHYQNRRGGAFLLDDANKHHQKRIIISKSTIIPSLLTTTAMKAAKQQNQDDNDDKQQQQSRSKKQIVFIRHSTTYMNEYLGRSLSFGAPKFTDVFHDQDLQSLYRDTPLSPRGIQLVQTTLTRYCPAFCQPDYDLNLVVVSPLKRALQTFHIGLRPHLLVSSSSSNSDDNNNIPPVIVLPEAAERLYLISDVGTPVDQLEKEYGYMDFTEIKPENRNVWWWTPPPNEGGSGGAYVEWRPTGQGQRYACPGEPQIDFDARMLRLYQWLDERYESKIAVVCHHGVIEWMLDMDFDNCQWHIIDFDQIQPLRMKHIMSSSSYY